jgi:EAL domain-containing protein (putative c-di-GMP-specific phosphodiesterase class I)
MQRHGRWRGLVQQRIAGGEIASIHATVTSVPDANGGAVAFIVVSRPVRTTSRERQTARPDLDVAVAGQHLRAHYLPAVRFETRETMGFEAVPRWQTLDGQLWDVAPLIDASIEVAMGRAVAIGLVRDVCRALADVDVPMSVNLPVRAMDDPAFIDEILQVVGASGIDADRLWFELDEFTLTEHLDAVQVGIERLHDQSFRFIVDEFGTASSSLAYLRRLPISMLKIDAALVAGLHQSARDLAAIRSIVAIAHDLGIGVGADGVRAPEQASLLSSVGCTFGQGPLFAAPALREELRLRP